LLHGSELIKERLQPFAHDPFYGLPACPEAHCAAKGVAEIDDLVLSTHKSRSEDPLADAGGTANSGQTRLWYAHGNHANTYAMIVGSTKPTARAESDSIHSEKPLTDVLLFEVPLKAADFLTLDLPASKVNEKGLFRFRIPATMIEWRRRQMPRLPKP
jgi:hypothetical protein